jgi:hypothetical protein
MHYVLTTDRGNEYKFYILACAETYRIMWGGTIRPELLTDSTVKLNHLRLVA